MKKIALVFIISFILAVGVLLGIQYYLNNHSQKGALQVTSSPQSKVYLNNRYIGQTPLCKCENPDTIDNGEYTIRLVPLDSDINEFQEKITISQNVLTVVDRKFGKGAQSEGSIISLTPLEDKEKAELLVVSLPQSATVLLDNQAIGKTPLFQKNPTESDHVLNVSKQGYAEKEVRIRTPLGYKLTVAVYLSVATNSLVSTDQTTSASAQSASSSATPIDTVTIQATPTGSLQLRAGPSLSAATIGQVKPGSQYKVVGEVTGWYEISLEDGTVGWVSSMYAIKN